MREYCRLLTWLWQKITARMKSLSNILDYIFDFKLLAYCLVIALAYANVFSIVRVSACAFESDPRSFLDHVNFKNSYAYSFVAMLNAEPIGD